MTPISLTLIIVGSLYTFFYLRGMVWFLHMMWVIVSAMRESGVEFDKRAKKDSWILALFKSLFGFPVVGVFCLIVTRQLFEDIIRDEMVKRIIDGLVSKDKISADPQQLVSIQRYLEKNLTV